VDASGEDSLLGAGGHLAEHCYRQLGGQSISVYRPINKSNVALVTQ
jgi:hypothetical protein